MARLLLNNLPDWALFILFLGVPVGVAWAALYFVRNRLHGWKTELSGSAAGTIATIVTTFFALVLAFSIVNLYQTYQDATFNANAEANSLTAIGHDSLAFPASVQVQLQKAIADYVVEVQTQEFPAMSQGDLSPTTDAKLTAMFNVLENYSPQTPNAVAFYNSAIGQLNQVLEDRESRVNDSDSSLPLAFFVLLLFTGVLSVVVTLFITTDHHWLEYALVAAVASIVGIGWLTVLLLEYPFSGSVAVSSSVFSQGYLGQLVALYN